MKHHLKHWRTTLTYSDVLQRVYFLTQRQYVRATWYQVDFDGKAAELNNAAHEVKFRSSSFF